MSECHFCDCVTDLRPFEMRSRDKRETEWRQAVACGRCWSRLRPELRGAEHPDHRVRHAEIGPLFAGVTS